jgi:predicted transcriptional regulator
MGRGSQRARLGQDKCDDILRCVLNLNRQEIMTYKTLVKNGPMRAEELAKGIGRHRSTASRCLMRLETCGICRKRTMTIEKGGFYYVYEAVPPEEVKRILRACTEQWYEIKKKAIDTFLEE